MFIVKIVDSIDTLSFHQLSATAGSLMKDTTETKRMTGLMDKAIAKANQNEQKEWQFYFCSTFQFQ